MDITRKVIVFIAVSTDGFIAGENDDLSFLDGVQVVGEDYGYHDFVQSVDTVIMGRKTYDKVLGFGIPYPHTGRKSYVVSKERKGQDAHVTYWNDDPGKLVHHLRTEAGGHIFVDGGSTVIRSLLQENLIDRFIISTIPCLVGKGVKLFETGYPAQNLKLLRSCSFPSGLVQCWYERI